MTTHTVHRIKTISVHQTYHGWPTVARLRNGALLVVVSAGRERHVCPFGQVHLIRSLDNGQTWSRPVILANGPLDDRDAGILQTSRATVLVNWFTSVAAIRSLSSAEAEGRLKDFGDDGYVARCQKIRALLTEETIERELGTWMLRSTDDGQTWAPKRRVGGGAGSPHGPTQLADGRLLFVGNWKYDDPAEHDRFAGPTNMGSKISDDDGRSWKPLGPIPLRPGDEPATYHEPHAAQIDDGRIVVHIRNHSQQDKSHILQSESDDGGATFSVPRNTGLIGLPAHLLVLRDGRLLSTYGYRREPYGNRAAISEDGGRTWSDPMILDEKPPARDLGYPSSVELEDGSILSVWYEKLPGDALASVQAAHWSPA